MAGATSRAASARTILLRPGADLTGFRDAARRLAAEGVPPEAVTFSAESAPSLFGDDAPGGPTRPSSCPGRSRP